MSGEKSSLKERQAGKNAELDVTRRRVEVMSEKLTSLKGRQAGENAKLDKARSERPSRGDSPDGKRLGELAERGVV